MALSSFLFLVRDNSGSNAGLRMAGLTPTWVHLKDMSTLADIATGSRPAITEVANGQYRVQWDPVTGGEVTGQIDAGAGLANPGDRYVDVLFTKDTSGNIATDASATILGWANYGYTGTVTAATSATVFTVDFGGTVDAADFANALCGLSATTRRLAKQVTSATQVTSARVALTLATPFAATPAVGAAVYCF